MPSLEENKVVWDKQYDWGKMGEEWSEEWGNSFCQWHATIYPRIAKYIPTKNVLEIAPGFGRWAKYLIPQAQIYHGIDMANKCIEACKKRFSEEKQANFFNNDGKNLLGIGDIKYDFIFSFDSLVHAEIDVLEQYIPQTIQMLNPNGVVFMHHSNCGIYNHSVIEHKHWRAKSVTAEKVEKIITASGGQLITQEILNWCGQYLNDAFSLYGRYQDFSGSSAQKIISKNFDQEQNWAKNTIYKYYVDNKNTNQDSMPVLLRYT